MIKFTIIFSDKMFAKKQKVEVQFKQINTTAVCLSETKADYADSMALLQQEGLRPMTYKEALALIDRSSELKQQLKGKWFYLEGEGLEKEGCHTFDNEGNLRKEDHEKGNMEKTVDVFPGEGRLVMIVQTDSTTSLEERRFVLYASADPQDIAPVVVGVKLDTKYLRKN